LKKAKPENLIHGERETVSTDALLDFNGDGLAELAVGRLPFRNWKAAAVRVDELIDYENGCFYCCVLCPDGESLILLSPLLLNNNFFKRLDTASSHKVFIRCLTRNVALRVNAARLLNTAKN
jgi:hypothetical protein